MSMLQIAAEVGFNAYQSGHHEKYFFPCPIEASSFVIRMKTVKYVPLYANNKNLTRDDQVHSNDHLFQPSDDDKLAAMKNIKPVECTLAYFSSASITVLVRPKSKLLAASIVSLLPLK